MNYQASNLENLSETPERLSVTKMRSGSPAAAAKKWAAEVHCTNLSNDCGETVQFAQASPGSDVIPDDLIQGRRPFYPLPSDVLIPELRLVKEL